MALNPFLNPTPSLSPSPSGRSPPSTSDHAPTLPQIQVSSSLSPTVDRSNGTGEGERRFEPPPGPPPGSTGGSQASGRLEADDLAAEAPPAYTPAADVYQGESTLEVGPRRPFQQVPPQASQQQRPPPPPQQQQPYLAPQTEWDQYQRHTRQGQWAQSNPSLVSQHSGSGSGVGAGWTSSSYGGSPNSAPNLPPPPPRHPHSQNSTPPNPNPNSVSDFARDFYAAGAGDASESQSSSSTTTNRYAPPSGAPPPPRPKSSNSNSTTSKNKNTNKAGGEEIADDGRPTHVPTPGHPLLLNSKLLVYPVGFECHKCNNTGFKNFDPSHPCRKCWERYSRPYVGAITYTPWSSSSASGSGSGSNTHFQRPLPVFRPPQHVLRSSSSSQSQSQHTRSVSSPNLPPPPPAPAPRIQYAPSPSPYATSPPPGSTVVRPGDPRIGGRMCYKCLGSGSVQFFIFEDVCVVCGGVGRVF